MAFCPIFVLRKWFLSLEKLFLVPILPCGANSKIAGYSIYTLIDPITGR